MPFQQIAGFFPYQISQGTLGSGTVGMHHQTVLFRPRQIVRDDFTEGFGKQAFVQMRNGAVDFFFAGRHSPAGVTRTLLHGRKGTACPLLHADVHAGQQVVVDVRI
jgi:hypothetical protein